MTRVILAAGLAAAIAVGLDAQQAVERIDIEEFRKLYDAKKVLVVDVRDVHAFAIGHIPGAINVPLGEEERAEHLNALKAGGRQVVTYCA
jgi:ArsR family transcriptional regulator